MHDDKADALFVPAQQVFPDAVKLVLCAASGRAHPCFPYRRFVRRRLLGIQPVPCFGDSFERTDDRSVMPCGSMNVLDATSPSELQNDVSQLNHSDPPWHGEPPKGKYSLQEIHQNSAKGGSLKLPTSGVSKIADGGSLYVTGYTRCITKPPAMQADDETREFLLITIGKS